MENSDEILTEKEPLLKDSPKGGMKTMPFILANVMLMNVACYGLMPSMGLFLTDQFHVELTTSSNIMFIWLASFNLTPVIGAAIADSYLGRYNIIGFGSVLTLLGMILLWLTTFVPGLSPPPCNIYESESYNISPCRSSTVPQLLLLSTSLGIISIGSGGVRSSVLAFGVDQLSTKENKGEIMQKFFGWYYSASMASMLFSFTFLVYIQEKMGWKIGLGISVVLMLLATPCFFAGSSYYVKSKVIPNLFTAIIQVVVASYKKRRVKTTLSEDGAVEDIVYHHGHGSSNQDSQMLFPTEKFRFLNKACIIEDEEQELNPEDGTARDPWSLCRVEQVEDLKALLKVIPIWLAGVIAFVSTSQGSFPVLQSNSMNRKIISNFEIPAGSFSTVSLLWLVLWMPLYDGIIIPIASRIKGKPTYFSTKQRIGAGYFVTFLDMVVTALVEGMRRSLANDPSKGHGSGSSRMSALWLLPQCCFLGIMEALVAIGQGEFYIAEFPKGMWSIAASLSPVELSASNLLSSFLMNAVDVLSKRGGHESWVSTDINKGHFDYYFWLLSGLCFLNFLYYLYCCWSYGPTKDEQYHKTRGEQDGLLA